MRTARCLVLLALCCGVAPWSAAVTVSQQAVKSAFVLNMARFIRWPAVAEPATTPFHLCHYRTNILGRGMTPFLQTAVQERPLTVEVVDSWGEATTHCQLLLVGPEELNAFKFERGHLTPWPVLVIADLTDDTIVRGVHHGVHINLVRRDSRIGFEVNLGALQASGLKASSELLKLAEIIGTEGQP